MLRVCILVGVSVLFLLSLNASCSDEPPCIDGLEDYKFTLEDEFSLSNTFLMMKSAWAIINKKDPELISYLKGEGYGKVRIVRSKKNLARLFMGINNGILIISFEGTNNSESTLGNCEFGQAKSTISEIKGSMHKSFFKGFATLLPELKKALAKFPYKDYPIIIGGHSRGGALAAITAIWLKKNGYRINAIYSLAQPHIGDVEFVDDLRKNFPYNVYRMNMEKDMTPFVPPSREQSIPFAAAIPKLDGKAEEGMANFIRNLNYSRHHGKVLVVRDSRSSYLFNENSEKVRGESFWEEIRVAGLGHDKFNLEFLQPYFNAHDPINYICALADLLKKD